MTTQLGADVVATTVDWKALSRPVPSWFPDAKLGIFIHWGAYSVPSWAEPTGELGAVDDHVWFRHNPYAEWYRNTIRFEDSPARRHHREVYDDAPYDAFLDAWSVDDFDASSWVQLFVKAGARYVVPTTKHHDGIALWDAPGTGTRNTVLRGPHRDLIGELEAAVRTAGLRFGVYYSGGLDWSVSELPVIDTERAVRERRPKDAAYAAYAYLHVQDLIDRFQPDVLWNDIEWPDAGKHDRSCGLAQLFAHYYATVPEGVVNDRWGDTHFDYRTSEYQAGLDNETAAVWENCRGIGLSFGYNQVEDDSHLLSGPALVRHFVDVVSRGGNLLLNVGPTARGLIPEGQQRALLALGDWLGASGPAIYGSRPLGPEAAAASDEPWVRWTADTRRAWAIVDAVGEVQLEASPERLDPASAALANGAPVAARPNDGGISVTVPAGPIHLPIVLSFDLR
jgi:alpha-L-fucosidase